MTVNVLLFHLGWAGLLGSGASALLCPENPPGIISSTALPSFSWFSLRELFDTHRRVSSHVLHALISSALCGMPLPSNIFSPNSNFLARSWAEFNLQFSLVVTHFSSVLISSYGGSIWFFLWAIFSPYFFSLPKPTTLLHSLSQYIPPSDSFLSWYLLMLFCMDLAIMKCFLVYLITHFKTELSILHMEILVP